MTVQQKPFNAHSQAVINPHMNSAAHKTLVPIVRNVPENDNFMSSQNQTESQNNSERRNFSRDKLKRYIFDFVEYLSSYEVQS